MRATKRNESIGIISGLQKGYFMDTPEKVRNRRCGHARHDNLRHTPTDRKVKRGRAYLKFPRSRELAS
jgi:hypothetical protein